MGLGRRCIPTFALAVLLLAAQATVGIALPPVFGPETWTLVDPGLAPRYGHTITYDPVDHRLILFGGAIDVVSSPNHLADVWELSLSGHPAWHRLQPTGPQPPPRQGHTAVYDAANHRILIHGGSGEQLDENADVWALSLGANPSWTHMIPGGTPPNRYHQHVAVYDPVGQRMIAYGGLLGPGNGGEVRILSLAGSPSWSVLSPPGHEWEYRRSAAAIYDPIGQRMVVIGGGNGSNSSQVALALSLDGPLQWSALAPNGDMTDVRDHTAVYNPDDNSILVFGGFQDGLTHKTWKLSLGASPAWTEVIPQGDTPTDRRDHAAAYDPVAHRALIFGGLAEYGIGPSLEDTQELWTLTPGGNPTWQEIDPNGAQPKRGWRAVMSADALGQRMIVTGGNRVDRVYMNQAHYWSTTGVEMWHAFGATGTPPDGRAGHTTIVDAANNRLVLFGGQTVGGTNIFPEFSNEVWVAPLGPNPVWSQLTPGGGPPAPRADHTAIYDTANQRMIVWGGVDNNGSKQDCWALSLDESPTWAQLFQTGSPPSARHGHAAIYDAPRQRMIVHAGATGGGLFSAPTPVGDIRAFALDGTNAWSVLATIGNDPSDRYGHSVVYDPVGHRMVVFGGQGTTGMRQDSWSLALWKAPAPWKLLQPLGTLPSVRSFAASGYDAAGGRMFVFGGGTPIETRPLFDMWTLTLNSCAPPFITAQPLPATQPFGSTATFSVTATGAVGYRWQKGGVPLSDGGRISGALTSTLSIASFQASDVGSYRAQVFGACDTILSDVVTLAEGCVAGKANPPAHMAAWWAMDPGVGNTVPCVLNPKSNKNHASLTGNAALVSAVIGTAVRCDGVDDGLHVPSTLSPELARNSTGLSIDAWIHPRSGSANGDVRMIFCKGLLAHGSVQVNGGNHLAPGYALYLHSGGQLGFQMPDDAYQPVKIEPALPPLTMDTWHHVAVSLTPETDGGGLFVDGQRVHTFTPPSRIIGNLADAYVGRFPPQLGPEIERFPFNGDIDEVEVFTAAISDTEVEELWLASCAGKRRELALVPAATSIRRTTAQAQVCGSIANLTAAPANYSWTLQALDGGPGCASVPMTFASSSGSLSVGQGSFGTVSATVTIDAPLTEPFETCFRLTVTNLADGGTSTADGKLTWDGSPVSANTSCTPPPVGISVSGDAGVRGGSRGSLAMGRDGGGALAATSVWAFTVTNDSTDAIQLDYEIVARDANGDPSILIGLDGQAPGAPASGTVLVPALGSVQVPVSVSLEDHEPFLRDQVQLRADLDGDLVFDPLASSYVQSPEDTSLVLLSVGDGPVLAQGVTVSPNPFRMTAGIRLVVPVSGRVDVAVYDVLGRRVRSLRSGILPAGEHHLTWDGRRESGERAAGGLYFIRVVAGSQRWVTKVVAAR